MFDTLFERLNEDGGGNGFAIIELPTGTELPSPGQEIDPAKLFAGMRVVVSRNETIQREGLRARKAILVRLSWKK